MTNKYLDPFRLHFLSTRGFITEAILESLQSNGKRFSKKDLLYITYNKISQSSINLVLTEMKRGGILKGYKEGRSYFYEVADEKRLRYCREATTKLPQRNPYTPPDHVSLCLSCEGTTIDIAASESRGRPLFCEECNGEGINDWVSKITRDTSGWL